MKYELRIMITKKAGTLRPFASQLNTTFALCSFLCHPGEATTSIGSQLDSIAHFIRSRMTGIPSGSRDKPAGPGFKLATSALLIFSFFLLTSTARAQQVDQSDNQRIKNILSVSPAIIDVQLKKGEKQTYEIKVKNQLDQPLGIRTSIGSFSPEDEESAINFTAHSPLMNYSMLSSDSFIIPPGQTKSFNLRINSPRDLKDGGYYEAVFLIPFYVNNDAQTSPTVLTQVGILVFANAGEINYQNLSQKVKILDLKSEKEKQNLILLIRVENSYFNHFSAKPFLTLTPLFGKPQKFELTEKKILPGKIRRWEEEIKPKNKSLIYKADLAVSIGQGNYVRQQTYFVPISLKKVLLIATLILFVIFVIWRKKQIKRAIKVIIKGK